MKSNMKMSVVVLGLAVVAAAVFTSLNTRPAEAQMPNMSGSLSMVIEGNYSVAYEMAYQDSTAKSEEMKLVKRIEFHGSYIVLIDQNGKGKLLPTHAIKEINWHRG